MPTWPMQMLISSCLANHSGLYDLLGFLKIGKKYESCVSYGHALVEKNAMLLLL